MIVYDHLPMIKETYHTSWAECMKDSKLLYPVLIALWIADLKHPGKTSYVWRDEEKLSIVFQTEGLNDEALVKHAVSWLLKNSEKEDIDFSAAMRNWWLFNGTALYMKMSSFLDFFKPEILKSEIWDRIFENDMKWLLSMILPPVSKKKEAFIVAKNVYNYAPKEKLGLFLYNGFIDFFLSFCTMYPDICPKCHREFPILTEDMKPIDGGEVFLKGPMLLESVEVPSFTVTFPNRREGCQSGYCSVIRTYQTSDKPCYLIQKNAGDMFCAINKREDTHLLVDQVLAGITERQFSKMIKMKSNGNVILEYYDLSKLVEE